MGQMKPSPQTRFSYKSECFVMLLICVGLSGCLKVETDSSSAPSFTPAAEVVVSCSSEDKNKFEFSYQNSCSFFGLGTETGSVNTWASPTPLHIMQLKKGDFKFTSCELVRLETNGVFTLKIFQKTNLVISVDMPPGQRVLKLNKNLTGWKYTLE
jgi:hypothetical protein